MQARDVSMAEAVIWMSSRKIDLRDREEFPPFSEEASRAWVWFTDGSAVSTRSNWSGPRSELTPDVDADPPTFAIHEPE